MHFFLCILCCLALPACGYSATQAQKLPRGFTRIFVTEAMDNTSELAASGTLTRILRERVATNGSVRVVALADAEVVLEARLDSVSDALSALASGSSPTVPKYVLGVNGSARLIDRNAAIVWQTRGVHVDEDYLSGVPICGSKAPANCGLGMTEAALSATESNRRRALERAAEQLAQELYSRLIEGF